MNGEIASGINIACRGDLGQLQGVVGGFQCCSCGRHFPSVDGIAELLPREALQETSPENSQLNAYRASFSNRPERAWRNSLGVFLNLLGNAYLYSWTFRTLDKLTGGQTFPIFVPAFCDGMLRPL